MVQHVVGQHALPPAGDLLADIVGHALLAGEGLQTAALAAAAEGSLRIQDHVAVLGGLELVAGEELAVEDEAAAHAGAGEEAHDVPVAPPRAELVFAVHAEIDVIAHKEGHAEALAHGAGDVIVAPGQVRGKEHDALVLVDDAGGAGGDGVELFPVDAGGLDHLLHHADDDLFHIG